MEECVVRGRFIFSHRCHRFLGRPTHFLGMNNTWCSVHCLPGLTSAMPISGKLICTRLITRDVTRSEGHVARDAGTGCLSPALSLRELLHPVHTCSFFPSFYYLRRRSATQVNLTSFPHSSPSQIPVREWPIRYQRGRAMAISILVVLNNNLEIVLGCKQVVFCGAMP